MIGTLRAVVLDAPDIRRLASFYAALCGWTELYADDDWIAMRAPDGWRVAFQLSPDHVPPRWPDPAHPQQAHLDLRVPDLDAASAQAVALGAEPLRENETWHTLADPAGHPFDLCLFPENPQPTLMGLMLDCPDAKQLSTFYAELLGKPVTYAGEGMAMIGEDGAQPLMFQQVTEYRAPRWPDPAQPQQFHLDVTVDDVEAAEAAVLKLGATSLFIGGENWRVYADPAGKPFCLCWNQTGSPV
ncbi:VOC family protein [Catellatospora tritici]|uniref:VOC family protein n=1 Tax=Catellatospora tritici TaxID=2851566 RepID=UPI001C2CC964|nr:VOC family protein [Catellatospora tritici]MBV1856214.1 VOC family protein [Catellatospora tritici]